MVRMSYFINLLLITFLMLIISVNFASSSEIDYKWTIVYGSTTGRVQAKAVSADSDGNIYIVGNFNSDFAGVSSQGASDIFIRKYTPAGNVLWTKIIGGTYIDVAYDVDVKKEEGIVIVGYFGGDVDFDPSSSERIKSGIGVHNGFIMKLTIDGLLQWINIIKQTSISQVSMDDNGDIFYSGAFQSFNEGYGENSYSNEIDFDPTGGIDKKVSHNVNHMQINNKIYKRNFLPDIFISKISPDGNTYYWTQIIGENERGFIPTCMSVNDAIYISGFTEKDTSFLLKTHKVYSDDSIWMNENHFKSISTDLSLDPNGYIHQSIISGPFNNVMYDLHHNDTDFPNLPDAVGLVRKYDQSGNIIWQYEMESVDVVSPYGLFSDARGNTYVTGKLKGSCSFDSETVLFSRGGSEDIFFLKLDNNGNIDWVETLGGYGNSDRGERLFLNGDAFYMVGQFRSGFDFNFLTTVLIIRQRFLLQIIAVGF